LSRVARFRRQGSPHAGSRGLEEPLKTIFPELQAKNFLEIVEIFFALVYFFGPESPYMSRQRLS